MGTLFKITCYAPNKTLAEKVAKEAFTEAEKINELGSDYIADSDEEYLTPTVRYSDVNLGSKEDTLVAIRDRTN